MEFIPISFSILHGQFSIHSPKENAVSHPIKTERYGELKFVKVYYSMPTKHPATKEVLSHGGSIGQLENGAWCHFPHGHPLDSFEDGARILQESNPRALPEFERWWKRQAELAAMGEGEKPRAIVVSDLGKLVYADTPSEEVRRAEDIHAYFQPGTHRDMIFSLFMQAESQRNTQTQREALAHHNATEESLSIFEEAARAYHQRGSTE